MKPLIRGITVGEGINLKTLQTKIPFLKYSQNDTIRDGAQCLLGVRVRETVWL